LIESFSRARGAGNYLFPPGEMPWIFTRFSKAIGGVATAKAF
jgi:hypothetical protein